MIRPERKVQPDFALLDGFDGMWRAGDSIFGIQNGMRPMRIVELRLSTDKSRVVEWNHWENANPAWTEPVGGSISGSALVYVGTGQWDRFGEGGILTGDRPPAPTEIRELLLMRTYDSVARSGRP